MATSRRRHFEMIGDLTKDGEIEKEKKGREGGGGKERGKRGRERGKEGRRGRRFAEDSSWNQCCQVNREEVDRQQRRREERSVKIQREPARKRMRQLATDGHHEED